MTELGKLILVRHGESTFNAGQIFTGLLDVPLTEHGRHQCNDIDELLIEAQIRPDLTITTPLRRAAETAAIIVEELGLEEPVVDWRLAERDYGVLTNMAKQDVREQFGEEAFFTWRRTVDGKPPAASPEQRAAWGELANADLGPLTPGMSESLRDVIARVDPLWRQLTTQLRDGTTILVVAHGNSLRALCALVSGLSDAEMEELNLPAAQPLVFDFDAQMSASSRYLDPETARRRAEKVRAEGGT